MKPLVSLVRDVKWPENELAMTQMCRLVLFREGAPTLEPSFLGGHGG